MNNLQALSLPKLQQVSRIIEQFFYSTNVNIAFYKANKADEYSQFELAVQRAIYNQIVNIATVEKIGRLLAKRDELLEDIILALLIAEFVSFEESINGGSETIDRYIKWAGNQGGETANVKLNIEKPFVLTNKSIISKLSDRTNYLIKSVDDTTKQWLAHTISEAKNSGMSNSDIARLIHDQAPDISRERAGLIVETETVYAMSLVELESYRKNGIIYHQWITNHDEKVCTQYCVANELTGAIRVGKQFASGTIAPPAHPRCRCYLMAVLASEIEPNKQWTGQ